MIYCRWSTIDNQQQVETTLYFSGYYDTNMKLEMKNNNDDDKKIIIFVEI